MSGADARVLVTGANGQLGRRLLAQLSGRVAVRAVVRSQRAAEAVRAASEAPPEIEVLDYRDAARMSACARGCSHAVHLVGILKEGPTSRYADAHEATSRALAEAADAAGLRRVVYLSIVGSRPDSDNPCLASKGRAEQILLAAATPALVLRVPMVLGEGDPASRALRGQARARVAPLLRGGAALEQPIYAGDVVAAIVAGLFGERLDDAALDLAGPESLTRRALLLRAANLHGTRPVILPVPRPLAAALAWLCERFLRDPPVTPAMLGVLDHDDRVDVSPATRRLGIALTPLDEALRRCVGPET